MPDCQQLADFSITCLDGSTFTLSENRGKVVFINLWATYCTPCVKELPQTIVLDRNGVVVYNQKGSVTPEILAALYEQASAIK